MRQRFAIIITAAAVVALLALLNTASYVSEEQLPDTEFEPDRSTYNAGSTGARALYDLLAEGGRQVMRWREPAHGLLNPSPDLAPSTFVVIGRTRVPFDQDEAQSLLKWVERGGRLVVIDRRPDPRLLPRSEGWTISTNPQELPRNVNPAKPEEMTAGVEPVRASQPSTLTRNVEAVQPSRFAGGINVAEETPPPAAETSPSPNPSPTPSAYDDDDEDYQDYGDYAEPPPAPIATPTPFADEIDYSKQTLTSPVPVAHFEGQRGALLVDYPHGAGRIVLLSDPYMVANGGIRLADNLQLALNAVAGADGVIAFDEYHQGRVVTGNPVVAYFAGTPVLWMVAQVSLVVLALLWTGGRRFARALPVPAVDRRSSLEFVTSMAELQERARAYDLAIENIYTRLRRVLVRQAGLGHNSTRMEIAERAAARSYGKLDPAGLEQLMRECEEAINTGPVNSRKSLELVTRLREVERVLGLRMRSRETRQAAEGLQQNTLL